MQTEGLLRTWLFLSREAPKKAAEEGMDELVFAHRHKAYGAYDLRKKYTRHLLRGMVISIGAMLFVCLLPFLMKYFMTEAPARVVMVQGYAVAQESFALPKPAGGTQPQQKEEMPQPVKKEIVPVVVENATKTDSTSGSPETGIGMNDGQSGFGTEGGEYLESQPTFPGGYDRMKNFIRYNVLYPQDELETRKQGKVIVGFTVRADGALENIGVAQSANPAFDAEALRVVKMMPPWVPGMQKGRPVDGVAVRVTILFQL